VNLEKHIGLEVHQSACECFLRHQEDVCCTRAPVPSILLPHGHACPFSASTSVGLAFTPSTNETYANGVGGSRHPREFRSCIRNS
jgi:hypothetical protein